jgi:hypothetical protein
MKEFPGTLVATNKHNFQEMNYQRLKCCLRQELFEHIISHTEEQYYDIDEFSKQTRSTETTLKLLKELVPELEALGWTCKFSFGDTGLFIYSTDKPKNCWD